MKVIGKNLSEFETSVEIDLFEGRAVPSKLKKRIQEEVGNYLVEQTIISMNEKKSPVQGAGSFPALEKKYKKKKLEEVGSGEANLEYLGIMKDELHFQATENGIEIGVFGERAGAADGHNNLSGKSKLKTRKFLPDEGENYKKPIQVEVERIIADAIGEGMKVKASQFRNVETKKELYNALAEIFGPLSRSELQLAVYRSEELTDLLTELELLVLL